MGKTRAEQAALRLAQAGALDKVLKAKLKLAGPFDAAVKDTRLQLRKAYEDVLFLDYDYARKNEVETALWMKVHHRSIEAFRSRMSKFVVAAGTSKPVEYRKLVQHFVDFLKDSTRYYRGLVSLLITTFGVVQLHYVLQTLDMDVKPLEGCSAERREEVTKSCHTCFIYLGDLSRYRELQNTKNGEKNWGPALGYYQFARRLQPTAGTPMNQLAVVAIYTNNTLASSYYFLRASCAIDPFPTAQENLVLGFKKVLKKSTGDGTASDAMIRLLAQSFAGTDVDVQPVLAQLRLAITERDIASESLTRLVCAVIAVHHLKPTPTHLTLLLTLLQMLLEILTTQLNNMADPEGELATRVSAVVRGMLPGLRLLSRWLSLNLQLARPLWNKYVHAMTLCGSRFPRHLLPAMEPLAEDWDMRGFAPLGGGLRGSPLPDAPITQNEVLLRLAALLADAADIAAAIHANLAKHTRAKSTDANEKAMNQMVDALVT